MVLDECPSLTDKGIFYLKQLRFQQIGQNDVKLNLEITKKRIIWNYTRGAL